MSQNLFDLPQMKASLYSIQNVFPASTTHPLIEKKRLLQGQVMSPRREKNPSDS